MPSWNNDLSANKFKNMYIQDINSTGFALDVSGDVIFRNSNFGVNIDNPVNSLEVSGNSVLETVKIHNENGIHFDNQTKGSFIGSELTSDLVDGSSNFAFGINNDYQRIKQWTQYDTSMNDSSVLSVDASNNTFVAVGHNNFAYSDDDGKSWNNIDVDAGVYDSTYNYGIEKIRIFRNNDTAKSLKINEIQYWVNDSNIIQNSVSFSYNGSSDSSLNFLKNNNPISRDRLGINYISNADISNDLIITLDPSNHIFKDSQAIVLYNNPEDLTGLADASLQLIDYDGEVVFEALLAGEKNIYRLDGVDFSTAFNFGGNSNHEYIIDDKDYNFNIVRLERTAYAGLPMRFHELQIWKKKIPEETTFNNIILQNNGSSDINISEIELWVNVDGSSVNICRDNNYGATTSAGEYNGSRTSNIGLNAGSQIQVSFNQIINYDNIQSIVLYNPNTIANQASPFLYDNNINFSINLDASNLFTFNNFTEISNNDIFRFDGPAMNDNVDTSNNYDATSKIPSLENITYTPPETETPINISIITTLLDSLYIENVIQTDKLKPIEDQKITYSTLNYTSNPINFENIYDDDFDTSFSSIDPNDDDGIQIGATNIITFTDTQSVDDIVSIVIFTKGGENMKGV